MVKEDRVGEDPSRARLGGSQKTSGRHEAAADPSRTSLFCVVDLHAITQHPRELARSTRAMATALLACGLNTTSSGGGCALFVQSSVCTMLVECAQCSCS